MDQRDSYCPHPPSSEITAKGTGLELQAGKEDPVELDSNLVLWSDLKDVDSMWEIRQRWNTTTFNATLLISLGISVCMQMKDINRPGVWLGRHICYTATQMP
jgi:hypothetical protein